MVEFYTLEASTDVEEYVSVFNGIRDFEEHCRMSEFQYFDTEPIKIEVDEDSGRIFQDFIYDGGVPIISDDFKRCLDELGADYLLYKKIILTKTSLGIEELYWLALPQRINCLNRHESDIDEVLNSADKIVINEDRIGRYEIFKLAGVINFDIVITKRIADALKTKKFVGLHINKLN